MSIFDLTQEQEIDTGFEVTQVPSTSFSDVFMAGAEATARNYLFNSKDFFENREASARDQKYKTLTGRNLQDDVIQSLPGASVAEKQSHWSMDPAKQREITDQYLTTLKAQDPDRYNEVITSGEITEVVKRKAQESLAKQEKVSMGATGTARVAGNLAGGVVASAIDPLNLATLPLGAGPSAGILKMALMEAGINAGAEVVSHPFIAEWQREIGNEYGFKDLAENAGLAAVFGAGMTGVVRGIPAGYSRAKSIAMGELQARFNDLDNPVAAAAAGYEARRLHLEESNPARLGAELGPMVHNRALEEVDSALAEGRGLDPEKLQVPDDKIRALDPAKMDEGTARAYQRIVEEPKAPEVDPAPTRAQNEMFTFERTEAPAVERQQELLKMYDSPEYKAREKADFDERVKDTDERIWMDEEKGDMSATEIRKAFDDDEKFFSAISACGLGGVK
jgi:hypothetical protein